MPFPLSSRNLAPKQVDLPEGVRVPSFVCDQCGQPIAHVGDGVFLINETDEDGLMGPATALFAHRDRVDDAGNRVDRCHSRLEERLTTEGRSGAGWLELRDFLRYMVIGFPGATETVAGALGLRLRDVWLLRWLAAGSPVGPLPEQPKGWKFALEDTEELADRLKRVISKRSPTSAGDDDLETWSSRV